MAQPPVEIYPSYKVTDRRSKSGYVSNYGASDQLYKASQQTNQRKWVFDNNADFHRNVSSFGRRTLSTLGDWLYANVPVVKGAIDEMAYYSVGTWVSQYYGRNPAWGNLAESYLYEHDKICNIDGGNMLDYLTNLIRACLVRGDVATVYTETPGGYPKLQVIPGHRIQTGSSETVVKGGPFDGATVVDGALVDTYGAPVAYRVWSGDTYEDIPASGMMLHFIRRYPGQLRGISELASTVFDWQDIRESRDLELAAQKQVASRGIIENNEDGAIDETKKIVNRGSFSTDGSKASSWTETVEGLTNVYFRAGAGCTLEEFKSDRPSVNSQEFKKQVMREALQGIGWNYDFTLDATKVGGVTGRIVVEKINKTIRFIQDTLARPASARFNFYRISKAIKNGELPGDPDSWKWDYQGPAKITADEKYSSEVAINEIRSCIKSPQAACAERNEFWEDVQDRAIAFRKRFEEKCKAAGVDPNNVIWPSPNGNPALWTTPKVGDPDPGTSA